ncbi:hypothetical protein ACWD25_06040 [Streptomyces sp. NPDC002920]
MSSTGGIARGRTWPRVLVLLLALLIPGAPAEASAPPVVMAEITEYDVPDTALRPTSCAARAVAPLRPAPGRAPAPRVPADRHRPTPSGPPYALLARRTVVLRC